MPTGTPPPPFALLPARSWLHVAAVFVVAAVGGPVLIYAQTLAVLLFMPLCLLVGLGSWPALALLDRLFARHPQPWRRSSWPAVAYWLAMPLGFLGIGALGVELFSPGFLLAGLPSAAVAALFTGVTRAFDQNPTSRAARYMRQ